jgi:uncharacterized membrane protein (DUF106 family)
MWTLNRIITAIFNVIFLPVRSLDPMVGMIVISVITGVVMLWLFKVTSNQEGIKQSKKRIWARLYEIYLYNRDLRVMLRAQKDLLIANLGYLRHSVKPMLFMIVPIFFILVQLNMRFGMRPFETGKDAVVTVKFRDKLPEGNPGFELVGTKGVKVERGPVRIDDPKSGRVEASWRIRMTEPGEHELALHLEDGEDLTKKIWVGKPRGIERISNGRYSSRDIGEAFLEPVEAPIDPKTGVRSITVHHPEASLSFFGFWHTHWLVWFCILSIVVGLALKNKFGVQI